MIYVVVDERVNALIYMDNYLGEDNVSHSNAKGCLDYMERVIEYYPELEQVAMNMKGCISEN